MSDPAVGDIWYSYVETIDDPLGKPIEYAVERLTPSGAWLIRPPAAIDRKAFCVRRWVGFQHLKKAAYPTKEQAIGSVIRRKEVAIRLLSKRLDRMRAQLHHAEWIREQLLEKRT